MKKLIQLPDGKGFNPVHVKAITFGTERHCEIIGHIMPRVVVNLTGDGCIVYKCDTDAEAKDLCAKLVAQCNDATSECNYFISYRGTSAVSESDG